MYINFNSYDNLCFIKWTRSIWYCCYKNFRTETSKAIELLTGKNLPKPRVATLRKINKINTSELIDEGIILWFPGPESYTGEDMAEIQVHGSKAVIDALHTSISNIENCR